MFCFGFFGWLVFIVKKIIFVPNVKNYVTATLFKLIKDTLYLLTERAVSVLDSSFSEPTHNFLVLDFPNTQDKSNLSV